MAPHPNLLFGPGHVCSLAADRLLVGQEFRFCPIWRACVAWQFFDPGANHTSVHSTADVSLTQPYFYAFYRKGCVIPLGSFLGSSNLTRSRLGKHSINEIKSQNSIWKSRRSTSFVPCRALYLDNPETGRNGLLRRLRCALPFTASVRPSSP